MCPSSPPDAGAVLLSVVTVDGTPAYPHDAMPITPAFLEAARQGGPIDQRFRFAAPCQEAACAQWAGGHCGLPDRLIDLLPAQDNPPPRCSIRASCRWHAQRGLDACRVCPLVTRVDAHGVPVSE